MFCIWIERLGIMYQTIRNFNIRPGHLSFWKLACWNSSSNRPKRHSNAVPRVDELCKSHDVTVKFAVIWTALTKTNVLILGIHAFIHFTCLKSIFCLQHLWRPFPVSQSPIKSQKRHLPLELTHGSGTSCIASDKKKGVNLTLLFPPR